MTVRRAVVKFHRWLGLAAALLWLLQAVTGMLIVFHWEIDDLTVAGAHHATDWTAIERRTDLLAAAGTPVSSIWTSAGLADRYDLSLPDGSVRIDGAGDVLRTRDARDGLANGGLIETIVMVHQSLLAGDAGHWIIGLSGTALLTNLALGLAAAWPRRRQWTRSLKPISSPRKALRFHSWHRAIGLWAAVPAMIAITPGTVLALSDAFETLAPAPAAVAAPPPRPVRIMLADAVTIALRRHPAATVSGIDVASPANPTWAIHLKQPGELIRAYGKTEVEVSAVDGRITTDNDALKAAPVQWLSDHLFALHTGEIAGVPGRIAMLVIGAWLATMIVLGVRLWMAKRHR